MDLGFSFKKTKTTEVEKYPSVPVMTFIGKDGYSKFKLNKKACELLKYADDSVTGKITYAKDLANDNLVLANTTGEKTDNQSNFFADDSFSSGQFLKRVEKKFEITVVKDMEFALEIPTSEAKFPVLIVTDLRPVTVGSDIKSEITEAEEIEAEEIIVEEVVAETVEPTVFEAQETAFNAVTIENNNQVY